jgi:hypothetical protein
MQRMNTFLPSTGSPLGGAAIAALARAEAARPTTTNALVNFAIDQPCLFPTARSGQNRTDANIWQARFIAAERH